MLMESNWSARNTDKKQIEGRRRNHRAMRIFIYARICPKTAKHLHTKLRLLKSKSGWPPSKHVECVYTRIYNSIQQLPFNISTYYSTLRAHKPIEWMRLLASSVPAFTCVAFAHTHTHTYWRITTCIHILICLFGFFFSSSLVCIVITIETEDWPSWSLFDACCFSVAATFFHRIFICSSAKCFSRNVSHVNGVIYLCVVIIGSATFETITS